MTGETNVDRRISVVEDEPDLRELLTYNLTAAGFTVQATENGTDGLEAVARFAPTWRCGFDAADIPGTEVCRRIRGDTTARQPAVMTLTAKGEEIDRVVGFELGADDYAVKPFSVPCWSCAWARSARASPAAGHHPGRAAAPPLHRRPPSWTSNATTLRQRPEVDVSTLEMRCPPTWWNTVARSLARRPSRGRLALQAGVRPAPSTPTSSGCATSWATRARWWRPCVEPVIVCQQTIRSSTRS